MLKAKVLTFKKCSLQYSTVAKNDIVKIVVDQDFDNLGKGLPGNTQTIFEANLFSSFAKVKM